jgi:predicted porin
MNCHAKFLLTTLSLFTLHSVADVELQSINGCKVKLGADLSFEAGTRIQDSKYRNTIVTANNSDLGFNSNVAAHLTIENNTVNNWNYGAQIGLTANTQGSSKAGKHYLDRTYIWTQHDDIGRFELGSNVSSAAEMQIKGDKSGGWDNYISITTAAGVVKSNFLTGSKLVFKETTFKTPNERSRKVTYYTPKLKGFQFGVSYIPDVTNNGASSSTPNVSTSPSRQEYNAIAAGATWEHEFSPKQTLEVALVGEYASLKRSTTDVAQSRTYNKSKAVSIGATYTHGDLEISSSYGNHFKTNTQKIANIPNAWFCDLGAEYQLTEKLSINGSAFYSKKFSNPTTLLAIGAEYQLATGIKNYLKITNFNMKQKKIYTSIANNAAGNSSISSSGPSNKGTALILGTRFKF